MCEKLLRILLFHRRELLICNQRFKPTGSRLNSLLEDRCWRWMLQRVNRCFRRKLSWVVNLSYESPKSINPKCIDSNRILHLQVRVVTKAGVIGWKGIRQGLDAESIWLDNIRKNKEVERVGIWILNLNFELPVDAINSDGGLLIRVNALGNKRESKIPRVRSESYSRSVSLRALENWRHWDNSKRRKLQV